MQRKHCPESAERSPSIFSCREFCASKGACCSASACTLLGGPIAGTWRQVCFNCSLGSPDYDSLGSPDDEMTSYDEAIRGQTPGYFTCCCD